MGEREGKNHLRIIQAIDTLKNTNPSNIFCYGFLLLVEFWTTHTLGLLGFWSWSFLFFLSRFRKYIKP